MTLDHLTDLELAVMSHLLRHSPYPEDKAHVQEILIELGKRDKARKEPEHGPTHVSGNGK